MWCGTIMEGGCYLGVVRDSGWREREKRVKPRSACDVILAFHFPRHSSIVYADFAAPLQTAPSHDSGHENMSRTRRAMIGSARRRRRN